MHRHLNLVVLLCGMGLAGLAASQPPESGTLTPPPPPAPDSDEEQVVVPLSEPVRRQIEEALRQRGRRPGDPAAPARSSGDPILDDVLEVIRRQGSVLEGSALDPQLDQDSGGTDQRPRASLDTALPVPDYGAGSPEAPHPDARFHVAELLLRTARELAALRRDQANGQLIDAMREQATLLLVDEYSQDMNRFEFE